MVSWRSKEGRQHTHPKHHMYTLSTSNSAVAQLQRRTKRRCLSRSRQGLLGRRDLRVAHAIEESVVP